MMGVAPLQNNGAKDAARNEGFSGAGEIIRAISETYFSSQAKLIGNIRTFALPFENQTYTFKMEYEYDSWNRMQTVTYPDGEAAGRGYTKHYYAESERICSKIGGGGLAELGESNDSGLAQPHLDNAYDLPLGIKSCLGSVPQTNLGRLEFLPDWRDSVQPENDRYWYHPDHLGSSSWITDTGGHAVQHLHYLPWGEDFVNQRLNGYEGARYTFSAKERDPETGLSYFGSRYYSSDLSIWLSVDPMSDKYPSLSPYVYCADNPVKLVDPNGEEIVMSMSVDENGNKVVNIKFTATLINKSNEDISNDDMTKYKDEIVAGIKKTYNGKLDDGTIVNVDVDINVLSKDESPNPFSTRHEINIVDKLTDNSHSGESIIGGGAMDIRLDICKGYYPNNPLDRTAAHEFGHLLGLDHVDDDSNVMNDHSNGRKITGSQMSEAYTHYNRRQLNLNIPYIKIREERLRKAMKYPK